MTLPPSNPWDDRYNDVGRAPYRKSKIPPRCNFDEVFRYDFGGYALRPHIFRVVSEYRVTQSNPFPGGNVGGGSIETPWPADTGWVDGDTLLGIPGAGASSVYDGGFPDAAGIVLAGSVSTLVSWRYYTDESIPNGHVEGDSVKIWRMRSRLLIGPSPTRWFFACLSEFSRAITESSDETTAVGTSTVEMDQTTAGVTVAGIPMVLRNYPAAGDESDYYEHPDSPFSTPDPVGTPGLLDSYSTALFLTAYTRRRGHTPDAMGDTGAAVLATALTGTPI